MTYRKNKKNNTDDKGMTSRGHRILPGVLAFILMLSMVVLTGCTNAGQEKENNSGSGGTAAVQNEASGTSESNSGRKLKIVTTSFAAWDWTRQVLGDRADDAEVTYLLDNGVDMHSYQPDAADISKILDADLFIYVGGPSDNWVSKVLKSSSNPPVTVNMLKTLGSGVKLEERVKGMEEEAEDHEGSEDHHHSDGHDHSDLEYDEHVWLSPENAILFTNTIADRLEDMDPSNSAAYRKNVASYDKKLEDLQNDFRNAVNQSPHKTIIVGDRFPFRYLTDEFGIKYYAAFAGCSAESEASFDTVIFLANKTEVLKVPMVLRTETGLDNLPETIIKASGRKNVGIGVLDSMQSVRHQEMDQGVTYISIMRKNLKVIRKALG